jgi:hypothetical protein
MLWFGCGAHTNRTRRADMTAHAESSRRCYDDLAHALDEQLELQPTRETRIMYRQLLGQA